MYLDSIDFVFYGDDDNFLQEDVEFYRKKWADLSEFVKDVKVTFSRFYNRRHNRIGTLWADRFKSLIVQDGSTLINCLSYIDLNPVRAGIVERPEEYRRRNIDGSRLRIIFKRETGITFCPWISVSGSSASWNRKRD
ncbi:MAG: hypothetical protein GY855_12605 [candidate division Zixibacteria bacterium]|nr:hypothetical protein [candidate division Zixibacteria bacterium]